MIPRELAQEVAIPRNLAQDVTNRSPRTPVDHRLFSQQPTDQQVFPLLLRYTSLQGAITSQEWESRFGMVSRAHPFGANIWHGMYYEMAVMYLPTARGIWGTSWTNYEPAWFQLPRNFSRVNAQIQMHEALNPSSDQLYPCLAPG